MSRRYVRTQEVSTVRPCVVVAYPSLAVLLQRVECDYLVCLTLVVFFCRLSIERLAVRRAKGIW